MHSPTILDGLRPELLWRFFYEISQIPRCSKREGRVTAYLEEQFSRLGLKIYSRQSGQFDSTGAGKSRTKGRSCRRAAGPQRYGL